MRPNHSLNAIEAERLLDRLTQEGHVLSASDEAIHFEVSATWFDELSAWRATDEDAEMDDGYGEAETEPDSQHDVKEVPPRYVTVSKAGSRETLALGGLPESTINEIFMSFSAVEAALSSTSNKLLHQLEEISISSPEGPGVPRITIGKMWRS